MPNFPASSPDPGKTLIFHIGDHKTGSTSIQTAFTQRDVTLENGTIFYPARLALNILGQHCKAYASHEDTEAKAKAIGAFQRLTERISRDDSTFSLISAEALEGVPAPVLRDIINEFFAGAVDDIRVVAYVRPHAARLISSFSERIKTGMPRVIGSDLDGFFERSLEAGEFVYHPRFTSWRQTFGDRFLLRPMSRKELHRNSVVEDFVYHAFGTDNFTVSTEFQSNESLDLVDLMRLKVLHEHVLGATNQDLRRVLGWEFARIVGQMPPSETRTKPKLHKALAEKIRSAYLEDARAMDRDFFEGQKLMERELGQAVETALPEAQSTEPADHLTASELRSLEILSRTIAGMLEAKQVNWPAFLHKKRMRDIEQRNLETETE